MVMCDKTHSYVWRDSSICVTRLIHVCDMTHSCVSYSLQMHETYHCSNKLIVPVSHIDVAFITA